MKRLLTLMALMAVITVTALGQRTVTGTVYSGDDNLPVIGASVLVKGTKLGTSTDIDGHFVIKNVPSDAKHLVISYIGMHSKEVAISDNVTVHLQSTESKLDEVMVVAYGTAKKSEYTGSASVVNANELQDALVTSVTSALSGKVSGVQVQADNGAPGEAPKLRIRGVGSINASSEPLYVVDGVPFEGAISDIAPADIESMTILKDAASTALYGARGANGVVLVTTKRGKSGQATVTVDMRWGSNRRALPNYNVLKNTDQYYEYLYDGIYNSMLGNYGEIGAWQRAATQALTATGYQIYTLPQGEYLIGRNGKINPNATLGYSNGQNFFTPDNWTDNSLQHGLRQDYMVSVSGGNNKIKYYMSGNYLGDEGIIRGSDFNRLSARSSVDYKAKEWLRLGANLNYTYTKSNHPGDMDLDNASSSGNAFYIANQIAPVYPMFARDAEGNIMYNAIYNNPIYDYGDGTFGYSRNWMAISNPIGNLFYDTTEYLSDIFDSKWYVNLTPIEGLSITGNAGYWVSNQRLHLINNPFYGQGAEGGGFAEQYNQRTRSINLQALASYNHTFADVHNMDVMVGYETYNLEAENAYALGYNLYSPFDWTVSNTIDRVRGGGSRDIQYTTRGILARVKYSYDNKYFFMGSYRRDSSSRFAPGKRWGNFFSVSGAWDIAKEAFAHDWTNVNQLKLKVSFGQNGNDNLAGNPSAANANCFYYAWQDQYQRTGADGVWTDATLYFKGNPDITWETSNSLNAGFDFAFFGGKLTGTAEYYQRQVSDMLFNIPTAPSVGYSSFPANAGSMRNYGVEIDLNYEIFNTDNFSWSVNANLTTAANKVISLPDAIVDKDGNWITGSRIFKKGHSMYNLFLVDYAGVNPENGAALYWVREKATGKEVKSEDWSLAYSGGKDDAGVEYERNRKETGNIMPKAYGGFGTSATLWGFDVSISFAYQFGGRIMDYTYMDLMHGTSTNDIGQNWHADMANRWTPQNKNTDIPRLNSNDQYTNSTSNRWLISSNYLSLNNITVGYTIPSRLSKKIGLEKVRVYGAAENVALWSKRRGMDPRQGYVSSESSTYSPISTISGGIRVEF